MEAAVFQALDLCLACKGCLAECPSGVDMAQLKAEFLQHHYRGRPRPLRDYLFGYFGTTAGVLAWLAPVVREAQKIPGVWPLVCRVLGLAPERALPEFGRRKTTPRAAAGSPSVLMLSDPYSHYVDTSVEDAALSLLEAAGYKAVSPRKIRSCAALISKGFLHAAAREAQGLLNDLQRLDPTGALPLVVLEPSELEAIRHDAPALLRGLSEADVSALSVRARWRSCWWSLTGFHHWDAVRSPGGSCSTLTATRRPASTGWPVMIPIAGMRLLKQCGYQVELLDAGCCGMGGTFGFEAEHYELSQKIGALKLFPAIETSGEALVAATGGACRMHITQGTHRTAEHPLVLAARALGLA